ncbi:biotin transporter BioY, partial [Streptococcus agalactiae]|nr:biotin transporter BioY [Streptococcus agalactiae]
VKLVNKKNFIAIFLIVWLAGVLFVDVAGAIWLASYTNIPLDKSLLQNLVFIPGDTIKAIIAAVVAVKYKDSFFLTEK